MSLARGLLATLLVLMTVMGVPPALAQDRQMTWAVHTTIVPTWFDPGEMTIPTVFLILYGIHDALVKPLPGTGMAPALAESWSASTDGLVYEFVLRKGVMFHNGEPVTGDDVRFSFERYRGVFAKALKDRVEGIDVPDAGRIRFRLKQPWPDFMAYYASLATAAGWVVP